MKVLKVFATNHNGKILKFYPNEEVKGLPEGKLKWLADHGYIEKVKPKAKPKAKRKTKVAPEAKKGAIEKK